MKPMFTGITNCYWQTNVLLVAADLTPQQSPGERSS